MARRSWTGSRSMAPWGATLATAKWRDDLTDPTRGVPSTGIGAACSGRLAGAGARLAFWRSSASRRRRISSRRRASSACRWPGVGVFARGGAGRAVGWARVAGPVATGVGWDCCWARCRACLLGLLLGLVASAELGDLFLALAADGLGGLGTRGCGTRGGLGDRGLADLGDAAGADGLDAAFLPLRLDALLFGVDLHLPDDGADRRAEDGDDDEENLDDRSEVVHRGQCRGTGRGDNARTPGSGERRGTEAGHGTGDDGDRLVDLGVGGEPREAEADGPVRRSGGMPIARSTGEGSREPEEQAAPAEAARPRSDMASRRASASRRGKAMLVVFQRRGRVRVR
jgi:hypothetical protein